MCSNGNGHGNPPVSGPTPPLKPKRSSAPLGGLLGGFTGRRDNGHTERKDR